METLCQIRDIYRSIAEYEARFVETFGVCLNEGMVLCSLNKSGNLNSGELATLMGLTNSNTSKVIASVEKKKLIRRVLGKTDKRQMYFTLTPKGKELLEIIHRQELEVPEALKLLIIDN